MKIKSKRFLISFLLMFTLIISLFAMSPLTASAATATGVVLCDSDGTNQIGLNSGNGCYLVNGESSNSGTLGEDGCTAYFDPSTGTLTLNGYNGGSIYVSDYTNNDLTIKLIGTNTITTTSQFGIQTQNGDLVVTSDDAGSLTVNVSGTGSVRALSSGYGNQVKGSVILSGNANVTVNVANNSLNDSYGIFARKAIEINDSASYTANMSGTTTSNDKNAGLYIESGSEGTITINTTGNVVIDTTATAADYTKPVNNATNAEGSLILTKVGTMTLRYKVWNGYESECTPSKWTYAENSFARRQEKDNSITTVTYKYGTPYTVKVSNGKYDNGEEVYASEYQYVAGETATIVAPSLDCGFEFKSWTSSSSLSFVEDTNATSSTAKITVGENDIVVFANYTAFSTQPTFSTTGVIESTTTPIGKINYSIAGGASPSYTYIVPTTGYVYGYGGEQCDVVFNNLTPTTEFVEDFNWPYNELDAGSYRIAIEVEDIWFYSDVFTVSYELDLTFNDNNNFDIVAGQVNTPVSEVNVSGAVYGGEAPYTFSKESGPEWLNVSAEGIITGTRPALVQDATTATIKVTDNAGTTRTIAIAIGAVTAAPTYQVSFDKNGGTGEMASVPVVENGTYELPACGFTAPTGYEFKCWSVNEVEKAVEEPITITSNTTVKAIWQAKSYTITFDTAGGSAIAPITQNYGTTVTAPAAPTKTGYTFKGWNQAVPSTMPAENMTITATWEINEYTITFNTNGGTTIAAIKQDYNTAVVAPADPTKEGHTFKQWDKTIPATMPAENITITAEWDINQYTITFDTDGGSAVAPITQDYGTAVVTPANPTKSGYTFTGWDKTIPSTMPAEDMTITAQWTEIVPNTYTVTYTDGVDNAEIFADQIYANVTEGTATPAFVGTPSRVGYTFKGWTPTVANTVTETVTYTATWEINQYTITFNTDGGSTVAPITQNYGTTVTAPTAPTKTGYTFTGWSAEVPTTMPAENVTLTAQWTVNQYTITFDTAGGNAIDPITQDYGTAVVAPANPTKDGYTFTGWDKTIPSTMPAENITITATWSQNHQHTDADGEWESDGTYHWHTCSCSHEFDKAECSGGTATCTAKAVCTVCNNEYGNTAAHSHGSEWKTDANEHWTECVCGDKANKAAHTDSNNDGKCDTCEYQMSTTPDNPDNPNNTPDNPNNTPDNPSDDKDGLGAGAIVGIVIGSVAVVGIGGFALFWFVIKKKSFADLIAVFKKK